MPLDGLARPRRRRRASGGGEPPRAGNVTAFPRRSSQQGRPAAAVSDRLSGGPRRLHNLPAQLSSFVGREREVAEIKQQLEKSRLLTLIGAGGMGKTRLALRVAGELIEQYPDGVWHVELAALVDPALAPQAVASALGVREEPRRSLMETLSTSLRLKELLVVLDNCEHLAGACAELAFELLSACSGLRILATSRHALGAAGETTWRVPPLSLPEPGETPTVEGVLEYEAPRLFLTRAVAARSTFALTPQNASVVANLCQRLDGVPLAIELAAVRVKALAVEQVVARLDNSLRLLKGSPAGPERHQTLWALADWSYGLLSEPERRLLRRLAAFAGGWTLEAAETVCSSDGIETHDVLELLAQLVAKSLVLAEERQGEMRYGMLEMIRQYAAEQLRDSGEEAVLLARHWDWVLALAEQAEEEVWGPSQVHWLDRLEQELNNVRSALRRSVEHSEVESGLRLAGALWRFWQVRGRVREGRSWLGQLLALSVSTTRTAGRAKALNAEGFLVFLQGDYAAAQAMLEEALAIWRELSDQRGIVEALCNLGLVRRCAGDFAVARALLDEALVRSRASGNRVWEARTLNNLARMSFYEGDYETSRSLHEESLTKGREVDDSWATAIALGDLGDVAQAQGDGIAALTFYKESLALWQRVGDERGIAQSLEGLAIQAAARSQADGAVRLLAAAAAVRETISELPSLSRRDILDRLLETARAKLGGEAYAAAWAEGRAMSLDQAVEYALSTADAAPVEASRGAPARVRSREFPLTARERQVAELIARGLSNREIAQELVISELTAETHVRNILRRLDLTTRAQVAAWVVEHGLAE